MLVPTVQYETYIYCVVPHCFCTVLYFIVSILYCTSLYLYWGSISCRCTSIVHWTVPCTLYSVHPTSEYLYSGARWSDELPTVSLFYKDMNTVPKQYFTSLYPSYAVYCTQCTVPHFICTVQVCSCPVLYYMYTCTVQAGRVLYRRE